MFASGLKLVLVVVVIPSVPVEVAMTGDGVIR